MNNENVLDVLEAEEDLLGSMMRWQACSLFHSFNLTNRSLLIESILFLIQTIYFLCKLYQAINKLSFNHDGQEIKKEFLKYLFGGAFVRTLSLIIILVIDFTISPQNQLTWLTVLCLTFPTVIWIHGYQILIQFFSQLCYYNKEKDDLIPVEKCTGIFNKIIYFGYLFCMVYTVFGWNFMQFFIMSHLLLGIIQMVAAVGLYYFGMYLIQSQELANDLNKVQQDANLVKHVEQITKVLSIAMGIKSAFYFLACFVQQSYSALVEVELLVKSLLMFVYWFIRSICQRSVSLQFSQEQ